MCVYVCAVLWGSKAIFPIFPQQRNANDWGKQRKTISQENANEKYFSHRQKMQYKIREATFPPSLPTPLPHQTMKTDIGVKGDVSIAETLSQVKWKRKKSIEI